MGGKDRLWNYKLRIINGDFLKKNILIDMNDQECAKTSTGTYS
jgi:hypothetical protein